MKCPKCNGKGDYFNEVYNDGKRRREILVECDMCHGSDEVPMTNEQWFCGLSTEEKAKVLRRIIYGNGEENEREEQGWVNWLKAKHEDNPPDIPSVPSWDRWLQGEKTKCELCDGSGKGVECNLAGRFECPKTPKTEQEHIYTCTTEELAGTIYEWYSLGFTRGKNGKKLNSVTEVVEWLKQQHTKE